MLKLRGAFSHLGGTVYIDSKACTLQNNTSVLLSSYQPSRRSVWENLDRGREYTPNAVRSAHATEVKFLPYRPTKLG